MKREKRMVGTQRSRLHRVALTGVLAPGLMLGVAGITGLSGISGFALQSASAQSVLSGNACIAFGATGAMATEMSVADVAEAANPAVVTILNLQDASQADLTGFGGIESIPGIPGADELPGIDEVPSEEAPAAPGVAPDALLPIGSGSGFIVDNVGHVVTNAHVVDGASELQAVLADGTEVGLELIGSEPLLDVAILKLDLPTGTEVPGILSFADSTTLRPGEEVVAIGNALGAFPNTVSGGTVNGVDRGFPSDAGLSTMIQHDAEIWHGNSGGPLLNLRGEVVGVNTAGISGGSFGMDTSSADMAFAVEGNTVCNTAAKLLEDGEIIWPYMGIQGEITAEGQEVLEVVEDGPAADAGLEVGDVITAFDGEDLGPRASIIDRLFTHEPGDTVDVTVDRDGTVQTFQITLGERPDDTQ
jgi:S1-C subfamily serine protease